MKKINNGCPYCGSKDGFEQLETVYRYLLYDCNGKPDGEERLIYMIGESKRRMRQYKIYFRDKEPAIINGFSHSEDEEGLWLYIFDEHQRIAKFNFAIIAGYEIVY